MDYIHQIKDLCNLFKRCFSRVVNIDDRNMPQESVGKWLPAWVSGRVTSSHELYSFKGNPGLVSTPVEASLLDQLPQK